MDGPQGDDERGPAELARYLGSRPADRLCRRLCSNVLVTVPSPGEAEATSYFTTYRVDGWTGALQPPPAPTQVGHYEDVFRRICVRRPDAVRGFARLTVVPSARRALDQAAARTFVLPRVLWRARRLHILRGAAGEGHAPAAGLRPNPAPLGDQGKGTRGRTTGGAPRARCRRGCR